MSIFEITFERI